MGDEFKKFGPLKSHSEGKIRSDDEGDIAIGIAADPRNRIIRIEFGTTISWLGLPANKARELAKLLVEKADEVDRKGN